MFTQIFNRLNDLTIRAKLLVGYGILAAMLGLVGIVSFVQSSIETQIVEELLTAEEEVVLLLQAEERFAEARIFELQFVGRYQVEGFSEASDAYLIPHVQRIESTFETIDEIEAGLATQQEVEGASAEVVQNLRQAITDYEREFQAEVNNLEIRGAVIDEAGLVGRLINDLETLGERADQLSDFQVEALAFQSAEVATLYLIDADPELIDEFATDIDRLERAIDESEALNITTRRELLALAADAQATFDEIVALDAIIAEETANFEASASLVIPLAQQLIEVEQEIITTQSARFERVQRTGDILDILLIVLALAVGIGTTLVISRLVTRQVIEIDNLLRKIRVGDFDARAQVYSRDELGRTADGVNAMLEQLTNILADTENERQALQLEVEQLAADVAELAAGNLNVQAKEGSPTIEPVTTAVNFAVSELQSLVTNISQVATEMEDASQGMNTMVNLMVQQSESSAEIAEQAANNATQGSSAVSQTIASMDRIRDNTQEAARRIKRLGEVSQEVSTIVRLIEDIADRTTVLALNASIQAAAAGEAGRGFSVVAEEVQRLAERATEATREIEDLVKDIQSETAETVYSIDQVTTEVVGGAQLAEQAGDRISELNYQVENLSNIIQHVASTTSSQTSEALGTLNELSQQLVSSISAFNLSEDESDLQPVGSNGNGSGMHSASELS